MPRFYFHIENVHFTSDDKDGFDFPSVEIACLEARRTIGEIIADELAEGRNDIPVTVRIRDEEGKTVADLAVRTRVTSEDSPQT